MLSRIQQWFPFILLPGRVESASREVCSQSLLQSKNQLFRCEAPTWSIWIDGKDAQQGPEAYGANYSKTMKHALDEVYKMAEDTFPEDLQERSKKSLQQFEHLAELLEMPFMYKEVGLMEMEVDAGQAFRGMYSCVRDLLPTSELVSMFRTELDSIYDADCIWQGVPPCRRYNVSRTETLLRLFESYHSHLEKGAPLRTLVSLMKGLALLHPLPDRNGRSRLLFLQLELRRLKLACGTMNFNNNNNVYVDSVQTLNEKLEEGIAMYNIGMASKMNPWLNPTKVQQHRARFPVHFDRELLDCYAKKAPDIGLGLLPG